MKELDEKSLVNMICDELQQNKHKLSRLRCIEKFVLGAIWI